MQTFLPYPDFQKSAECLDKRRCLKQIVEAQQIINVLEGKTLAWENHPAVKMWGGYLPALIKYYNVFYEHGRDFHKFRFVKLQLITSSEPCVMPVWLSDERFCRSHRSNLLRKKPDFYSKYGWTELNNLEYFWPTKHEALRV